MCRSQVRCGKRPCYGRVFASTIQTLSFVVCEIWRRLCLAQSTTLGYNSIHDAMITKSKICASSSCVDTQQWQICFRWQMKFSVEGTDRKRQDYHAEMSLPQFYDFMHDVEKAKMNLESIGRWTTTKIQTNFYPCNIIGISTDALKKFSTVTDWLAIICHKRIYVGNPPSHTTNLQCDATLFCRPTPRHRAIPCQAHAHRIWLGWDSTGVGRFYSFPEQMRAFSRCDTRQV